MPPDCYKVDIIHYLNPHLIWIEVCDPSVLKEEFLFEQIGIYSVLPLEKTLDVLTEHLTLKSQKCEEWLPAASVAMKELLNEADEVWFAPTYTDRRTTIFDDNTHKYGEIILKTRNGKFKKLSKHLIISGFAHSNVCEFHEKLSCGELKTKLCTIKTQEVIKELENYCLRKDKSKHYLKKSIQNQTSVFQMSQDFEMFLTKSNLEKHNNEIIKQTLINKYKDFELCKDIDDEPLGRACPKIKPKTPESNEEGPKSKFLIKQLSIAKKMSNSPKTDNLNQSYNSVTKFLNKESVDSEAECEKTTDKKYEKNDWLDDDEVAENLLQHAKNDEQNHKDHSKAEQNQIKNDTIDKTSDKTDNGNQFKEKTRCRNDFEYLTKSGNQVEQKASSNRYEEEKVDTRKTSKRSVKPTGHKSGITMQVAYGPPAFDPKFWKIQDVKIPNYEEEEFQKQKMDIEKAQTSKKCDIYGEVNSDIGIEITNKKTYEDYLKKGSKIGNLKDIVRKEKDIEKSVTSSDVNNHSVNSNERCVNYMVKVEKDEIVKNCAQIIVNKDNLIEKSNNKTTEEEKFVQSCIAMSYRDNSIEKFNKKKIQNESKSVECGAENDSNHSKDKTTSSLIKRKLFYHKSVKHNTNLSSSLGNKASGP